MSITSLPLELVHEICSYLQLSELQTLRLTDRNLYHQSLDTFSDRYFRSFRFLATSDGLRNLEEIAKVRFVRERVQELWMIPVIFEGTNRNKQRMSDYAVSSKSCERLRGVKFRDRYAKYQAMVKDNRNFMLSETFNTRLRKCIACFKKLDTIGLAHYTTPFLLDPRQQKVRFLGWRRLRDQMDFRFSPQGLARLRGPWMTKLVSLALLRLFQALGSQKIRKLHTCGADNYGDVLSEINLPQSQYDSLLSALGHLEDLRICTYFEKPIASDVVFGKPVGADVILKPHDATMVLTWFDLIIKVAPRLKVLAFSQGHYIGHDQPGLQFGELSRYIQFTQLKELHLHWIHLTSGALKSFLTTAKPTLSTFTLFAVILDDRTSTQSLLWKLLWDFFRDELSLQRFSMAKISCDHQQCLIRGLDDLTEPSDSAEFDVETAGISFSKWIDRLTPVILITGKGPWHIHRVYQGKRLKFRSFLKFDFNEM